MCAVTQLSSPVVPTLSVLCRSLLFHKSSPSPPYLARITAAVCGSVPRVGSMVSWDPEPVTRALTSSAIKGQAGAAEMARHLSSSPAALPENLIPSIHTGVHSHLEF